MKRSYILISLVLILMISQTVHAISGSIKPPKMVLRENVTRNQITVIPLSVEVNNPNNYAINVTMSGSNIIDIDSAPFSLGSGQSKVVNFDILVPGPGNYSGDASAFFSASGKLPLSLSTEIVLYAEEGTTATNAHPPS